MEIVVVDDKDEAGGRLVADAVSAPARPAPASGAGARDRGFANVVYDQLGGTLLAW